MPLHHDEELGNEGARVYVDTETRMLTINVGASPLSFEAGRRKKKTQKLQFGMNERTTEEKSQHAAAQCRAGVHQVRRAHIACRKQQGREKRMMPPSLTNTKTANRKGRTTQPRKNETRGESESEQRNEKSRAHRSARSLTFSFFSRSSLSWNLRSHPDVRFLDFIHHDE